MIRRLICLFCNNEIKHVFTWKSIWYDEVRKICEECQGKLEFISGKRCTSCSRELDERYQSEGKCLDCVRWENDSEWKGYLKKNESFFHYNDFLKEIIATFKYRGDYALAEAFVPFLLPKLTKMKNALIVPIPLSNERLIERGFNQAEALIAAAGIEAANVLSRLHSEKQSKKSREERISISQVFQVMDKQKIEGKKIILIDDIYTTGSTLRHAAKALVHAGAQEITSITLAR
ncbi:ComF family protein [Peribacillus sp. SCS-155]|uniref:ComF family protein n=1 Tax=Peribacillus sedimenti TaxID=3115297 RepID=UPI003905FE8B